MVTSPTQFKVVGATSHPGVVKAKTLATFYASEQASTRNSIRSQESRFATGTGADSDSEEEIILFDVFAEAISGTPR